MAQVYAPTSKVYEPTEIGGDVLGEAKARGIDASRDAVVADLAKKGVTDPEQVLAAVNGGPDGGDFTLDEVTARLGKAAPAATGDLVTVRAPDGKAYGLPASQVQAALAQGYTLESPEQKAVREYVAENEGLSGTAKVALDSFANEATFGVLDAATEPFEDPLERAKREALKADHRIANFAGGAAGFGTTFLYGGELFKGASAAGRGVEGAILGEHVAGEAIGQTVAKYAPEGAAALVAKEVGPGFARKLVASGAGTAVEGAMLSAPKALTEATFGDPNQAAETLLYGAGGGAILGLAGPVASKLKKVATEGFAGGAEWLAGAEGKGAIASMADKQAFRSIASNQASLGVALKRAEKLGGAEGIGETINELGLVRKVGEAPEAYAARLAAAKEEAGAVVGGLAKKLDTFGAVPDSVKIFDRIKADVLDPLRKNPGFEEIEAGVQKYLDSFASKTTATEGGLSFERLHEMRASLDDLVYRQAKAGSITVDELRKVRGIIEDEFTRQGDEAAKAVGAEFAAPWKEAKLTYGRLSAAEAGAKDYVMREAKNRVLSPTDNGWGAAGAIGGAILTGGPIGGAIAGVASTIGHHLLRTEGNGLLARGLHAIAEKRGLLAIEQSMKFTATKLDAIPDEFAAMVAGTMSKSVSLGVDTADTHAWNSLVANKTDEKSFTKMSDDLASLASDPAKMQAKLAELVEPFQDDAPNIGAALAQKASAVVQYLNEVRPKAPEPATPFQKPNWKPSDQQMQDFGRRVAVVINPFSVIARLRDKTLGTPEIETLHAIYPRLYEAMRKKVYEFGMTGKGQDLSYQHRLKLSLLLDTPADSSMAFLKQYQATFRQGDPGSGGGPATHGGAMGGGSGSIKPPALGTDVQRVSAK